MAVVRSATVRPLSREVSQAVTRAALLDAAEAMILESSLAGLSLRAVCARAGFTQGAFYSNFASREELLLALMERNLAERARSLGELTTDFGTDDLDDTLERVGDWLSTVAGRHEWARMAIELRLEGLRDPTFARRLAAAEARIDRLFAAWLRNVIDHYGLAPKFSPQAIVEALLILWRGIALRDEMAGEPVLPARELFITCLRAMLETRA